MNILGPFRQKAGSATLTPFRQLAATQTLNVNHGATPGPNRYGLWCLMLLTPTAVCAAAHLAQRGRSLLVGATLCTLVFSAHAMHPRIPEGAASPTSLATLVWTYAPSLDNPIPEVFAERLEGTDGGATVPVATPHCEKVLLVGDGQQVRWPRPCQPVLVPNACARRGAYCYSNNGSVVSAPWHVGFAVREAPAWWTLSTAWR